MHIYLHTIQLILRKAENHAYTFFVQSAWTSAKPNNTWHRVHNVTFIHLSSAKTTLHTSHIIHNYDRHIRCIQLIILLITQRRSHQTYHLVDHFNDNFFSNYFINESLTKQRTKTYNQTYICKSSLGLLQLYSIQPTIIQLIINRTWSQTQRNNTILI